jgi:hypothetical protein
MKITSIPAQLAVIAVVAGTLFLPSFTFASTSTATTHEAYISQLEAELNVLEAELTALLASQQPAISNTPVTANPVQVSVANAVSTVNGGTGTYTVALNVTNNATTTLYVPFTNTYSAGTQGLIYSIQGSTFAGSQNTTTTCPTYVNLSMGWVTANGLTSVGQSPFCSIAPGQTQEITTVIGLQPNVTGNYSVQASSLNYTFNKQPTTSGMYSNIPIVNSVSTNTVYIVASSSAPQQSTTNTTSSCYKGDCDY